MDIIQTILLAVVIFIFAIDQFSLTETLYRPIIGAILGDMQTGLFVGGAQPPNDVIAGCILAILANMPVESALGSEDIQTIRSVRISVAAPLGGIGDALFWYTFVPIVADITAIQDQNGSLLGPILFFVLVFGTQMAIRFGLMYWAYNIGTTAVTSLTKNAKEFTHSASVLGIFITVLI